MLAFLYHFHNKEEYCSVAGSLKCKNILCRPLAIKYVYLVCNPWNWEDIILRCCAAINTLLTCRECNLFICRRNPRFYICFCGVYLFGFTAPPDGWRPVSQFKDSVPSLDSVSVRNGNKGKHWHRFCVLWGTSNADCWCTASSSRALCLCFGKSDF